MPTWSELVDLSPWLAALAAAVAVLAFVAAKVVPLMRNLSRFMDDVLGAPARQGREERPSLIAQVASIERVVVGTPPKVGEAAEPGLSSRLASIERVVVGTSVEPGLDARVAHIEHEVTTNHGSSLKDAVRAIERRLEEHISETEPLRDQVAELHLKYTKEQ